MDPHKRKWRSRVRHFLYGNSFYVPRPLDSVHESMLATIGDGETVWQDWVVQLMCAYVRPQTTVMVVGAGIGCHVIALLVMTNAEDLVCMENNAAVFDILRHNVYQCIQSFPATENTPMLRLLDQTRTPLDEIRVSDEVSFILLDLTRSSSYACRVVANSIAFFEKHSPVILLQGAHLACQHLQDLLVTLTLCLGYSHEELATSCSSHTPDVLFLPPTAAQ